MRPGLKTRKVAKKSLYILLFIYTLFSASLPAQSRERLERQRENLRKEINRINRDLQKAKSKEKNLLREYELTGKKLKLRRRLIANIKSEIRYLDRQIAGKTDTVEMLRDDLHQLKENYANSIRNLYRFMQKEKLLYFILSSENFRQAWRRVRYLKEYSDFVKKKAQSIREKQQMLQQAIERLEEQKHQKQQMLTVLSDEEKQLKAEQQHLEKILAQLQREKRKYIAQIKRKQREARRLDRMIEKLIEEEIARRNRLAGKKSSGFVLTPEGKKLAAQFSANRGKLPWPVKRGYVSRHFGKQPHPVFKNISVINSGIYINVPDNEPVRSIFDGEVMMIQLVPGGNQTVYIRHGNYISIYGNLKEVFVKKGQKVKTKQTIGIAAKDPATGVSVLKFRIYQNRNKLNPELWLAKK